MERKSLKVWQIWNMNFGFFGIQFSFGLQQSNMSAIYKYLGAEESEIPILWLAGPVTGLIIQPIIGAVSDGTWSPKFGRRKPFFLIGAILASIALVAMPYSSSLWMAAGLLWILDAANNVALEPYRAFVSDILPSKQHSIGFLMQSFFTGLGSTLANFTPAILVSFGLFAITDKMDNGIPVYTYWAFFIGAIASISTVVYTVFTTKEIPPTDEEYEALKKKKKEGSIVKHIIDDLTIGFRDMPKTMKQLIPVMFFPWYAFFSYWQYITSALSLSLFGTLEESSEGFARSQVLTGNMNGTYNIICFLIAFLLVPIAAKLGTKKLHAIALSLGGIALIFLPAYSVDPIIQITEGFSLSTLYIYPIGLGITWASMMAIPYQILAQAVPASRTGIYMGIFNMFIVIPMIIQIITMQTFVYDLLGKNPINVIIMAGVFLILGGISTLFVDTKTKLDDTHGL